MKLLKWLRKYSEQKIKRLRENSTLSLQIVCLFILEFFLFYLSEIQIFNLIKFFVDKWAQKSPLLIDSLLPDYCLVNGTTRLQQVCSSHLLMLENPDTCCSQDFSAKSFKILHDANKTISLLKYLSIFLCGISYFMLHVVYQTIACVEIENDSYFSDENFSFFI